MKFNLQKITLAFVTGLALTATSAFGTNFTEITECGFTISQPGRYKVVNNLFCNTNDAFAIAIQNTEHVELDLQTYQLRMPGGQQRGIGIYLHKSKHIDIKADKSAFIYNFRTGISMYGYTNGGQLLENRDVEIKGGGMRLLNNGLGVLVRFSRDIELKELRTESNSNDWSLTNAKDVEFDKINLPPNQY
jgi:hypothetical protein